MKTGYLDCEWFAVENDLIGGWCVMPVNESPSHGVPEVADFTTKELAEHIANIHNTWLFYKQHRPRRLHSMVP